MGVKSDPATGSSPASRLVIVEDDPAFSTTLRRSFERRGYTVSLAASPDELSALLVTGAFDFAVVDLKLATTSGLACVEMLHRHHPETRIVVLTGFASIAIGRREGDVSVPVEGRRTSIKTVEWEYIHQTLVECDFNISESARRLGMHRRTLARKLEKRRLT